MWYTYTKEYYSACSSKNRKEFHFFLFLLKNMENKGNSEQAREETKNGLKELTNLSFILTITNL